MQRPWLPLLRVVTVRCAYITLVSSHHLTTIDMPTVRPAIHVAPQVVLVCHGAAAAEAQDTSSQNSASVGNQQQRATGAQQQLDTPRASATTADGRAGNAAAANGVTATAVRGGVGSSSGAAGKGSSLPMQDCSNDDSGLPLASLKVEAAWESHGLREGSDITIVTQMSPRRCARRSVRFVSCSQCALLCPRTQHPELIRSNTIPSHLLLTGQGQ
jgi:hypothetical protein